MGDAVRISVIGAGSATFSLGLIKDICLTEGLAGSEISFMDIDTGRLDIVTNLAKRYAAEIGRDLRITQTTDRQASMRDADFVINTAYPGGGHGGARRLRELTAKHGYYYGGGFRLPPYATFNLMLDVAHDMERICPDAWLIQSGNPVFAGCTLMTRETGVRVIGLCHGQRHAWEVADELGLARDRVTWYAPGVNHNIWMVHFLYDGKDAYPLLDRWVETQGEEYWRTHVATTTHDIQLSRGAIHMYHMYGLLPIGDTVRRGGWWYHTDMETKKYWFGDTFGGPDNEYARPIHVAKLDRRLAEMRAAVDDPKASMLALFGTEHTYEQQVPIIDALTNNNTGEFQVNVPNLGSVPGIADNVVVELTAKIDASGIHRIHPTPLPPKVMLEHVLPEVMQMERQLLAYQTGDRSMLLWDILDSHQTRSYEQAVAMLNDLLESPDYERTAAHFQWPHAQDAGVLSMAPPREAAAAD
jgi:alpha-galactosidase